MGRPLGPTGGRGPGGGGTGRPDGLSGGRGGRFSGAGGAAVSGALAAGLCAGGWVGGAGGGEVGRLLIRRGDRAGGAGADGAEAPGSGVDGGASTVLRTGAFLAGTASRPVPGCATSCFSGADTTAPAAFLAGLLATGSSGCTGRRRPSASALRRTRSAWASSMEEEWLLTPIPRERASSRPSLFVRPSSLASS